jgi:hypothetical protein
MTIPVFDYAGMTQAERSSIERTFAPLTMLTEVLDWGRSQHPPVAVSEIITQDEYTHDVLVPFANSRYLNFDTT